MSDAPIAAPALPPRRGSRLASSLLATRSLVGIVVLLVAGVGALIGALHHASGGSSTDGSFRTGDCVVLTTSAVHNADCGSTHDGRITAVLHDTYASCPSGSDEFDVTDNTGNLCVDRSDSSH